MDLQTFYREQWLAVKLGCSDFDFGVTTTEQRRERLRREILSNKAGHLVCARARNGAITFAAAFESTYGVPL